MSISKNTPLTYFDNLLESNTLKSRKDIAINSRVEKYGSLVESVDYEKGIVSYIDMFINDSQDLIEATTAYSFASDFTKEVIKESKKAKETIDNLVLEINIKGNNANQFLISQVNHLTILVEKSKVTYPKLKFIEVTIQNIITYLVDRYSLKESYKKRNLTINTKYSYFDIKAEVKPSLLEQLYDVSVDLEIIDDEIITEDTFMNVLSVNPTISNEVIIFKCNNELAAHFINCIQPLFNNLTIAQINKSKSFINKNNKTLNQADLDNANKRLRKKSSTKITRITNHISRILNP